MGIDGDLDLESALTSLAGADDAGFKFKAGESKTLTITTDFGKVTHVSTDLVSTVTRGKIRLDTKHAIVQKAMENGAAMFVIVSIYEGEHCQVGVTMKKDVKESGGIGAGAEAEEKVDDKHSSSKGIVL